MAPAPAPAEVIAGLDITRPGFFLRDDYFDVLAWLRRERPVASLADGLWLVSRYDDIRAVSRQPELFTSRRGALINDPLRALEPNDDAGSILHLDPPLHAEYRKLLNRVFTPRAVSFYEPAIRAAVDSVLGAVDPGAEIDFIDQVAAPIPVAVIADLLGIADGDRADFKRWSDATIKVTDFPSDDVNLALAELFGFLDGHVRRRFEQPGDDLLSVLATSSVDGVPLRHDQVLLFCLTLLVAGNETTRSLLSGGADVLAAHPDQRAALAGDESMLAGAVEEMVRWVTPIQAFCRTANQPVEVGGVDVPEGAYLVLLYASGNRDEEAFGSTAGAFDIHRPATPAHVAFGFGEHLCLGASLARLEARIFFEQLLQRFPRYAVTGAPVYELSSLTRSIATMPVRLGG